MVYDRQTGEVLALRRQFIYGPPYKGRTDSNSWLQGEVCRRLMYRSTGHEDVVRLPVLVAPPEKPLTRYVEPALDQPLPVQHQSK